MKRIFAGTLHTKFIAAASAFTWTIAIANLAGAAQLTQHSLAINALQEARVTQVVNDVKLLLEKAAPRPVALGDVIRHGTPVSTGTQSRGELTFDDLTITRLGANTSFSFKEGTRQMNLVNGAILFQVPKGSGGATIRTVGVTAAITGTTGIGEFHPASARNPHLFSKWLCLEGHFRLYLPNGQSVELGPGQMVTTDGKSFSIVLDFEIGQLLKTSLFFIGFDRPLPSLDLIVLEEQKQLASMLLATATPNPLDPIRIVNVIDQAIVAEEAQTSPSSSVSPPPPTPPPPTPPPPTPPPPTPTPSKFGTPPVITSSVPYLITSGTVITTDPSITTNGVTDFGKIYRGPVDDGAFSLWAFGSTSAVDTTLDFDTHFNNAGHFPAAAFKFTSLVLAGNPTIDLTNGGVTNLALISVGDITSGLPGGTLTFTGLDALLLASQDGSINLGSEITFQDIPTLFFYARGTNGDLTLASPIIGTTDLFLYAGRNITFNAGTDLILGGQFSTRSAGGNISVSESGNIAIGGSLAATSDVIADAANGGNITFATGGSFSASDVVVETTVEAGVTLTDGANITFDIGTGLTVNGGSLSLTINDSNGGTIGTGGNITLNTGANLTVNGGGALTLDVLNNDGGHIGTGGNISVTTGGNLTAGSIDALIDNHNGGTIDSSANLTFNIGGALTTTGDASFGISNRNDGSGSGMIGSNATVNVTANNISTGSILFANISNFGGGNIVGNTTINVTAANITAANSLFAQINNSNGGSIGGSAAVSFTLTGDLTTSGNANFLIDNSSGGTIGGNTAINVNAANITANSLLAQINNTSGNIGGNASINFNLTGDLQTVGDASFSILNGGGTIGGGSSINVNAASISIGGSLSFTTDVTADAPSGGNFTFATGGSFSASDVVVETTVEPGVTLTDGANITFDIGTGLTVNGGSLSLTINDSNGGTIGTGGNITLSTGANLTVNGGGALTLDVLNNDGGHIGTGGNISVTTGGNLTAGSIDALIDNRGGTIGASANINFNLTGSLTTGSGDAVFLISNDHGGTIGLDAVINMTANNVSTGGSLFADIENNSGGMIGGSANLAFNLSGQLATQSDTSFTINNSNEGMIGVDAAMNVNAASISTGGGFDAEIDNHGLGDIVGSANINLNLTGDLTTTGDASVVISNFVGTIGSDAVINVTANDISTGGTLNAAIDNSSGGTIGGIANLSFNLSGNLATQSDALFKIDNSNGGMIGADAAMNVSAASISTGGSLFARIFNYTGGSILGNANIVFNLAGDLTTQDDAILVVSNFAGGTIGDAAVTLSANNISSGGAFVAEIFNYGGVNPVGGTIVGNATINVTAANIIANSLLAEINNNGGSIGSTANVTLNVGGDLTTQGDALFQILNFDDGFGSGPGTIGSNAIVDITANNVLTGGALNAAIDNSSGGTIGGIANLSFNLSGNLATQSDALFKIDNSNGGMIGADAAMNVSAANISMGAFDAEIDNFFSGNIVGSANINFNLTGDLTTAGDATLLISNASGGTIGGSANIAFNLSGQLATQSDTSFTINNFNSGMIGVDAAVNVSATSISTGGSLSADILNNNSGHILGSANIVFNLAGDLTTQDDATLVILNDFGGTIGSHAMINVTANSASTGTLTAAIDNSSGGTIGGMANLSFNLGGGLASTSGDASFQIDNRNRNGISGGSINGDAIINIGVGGDISAQGTGLFEISNDDAASGTGGGTIGSNAMINVGADNISTGGPLSATIESFGGGTIGGNASINFNLTGNLTTQSGNAVFQILNYDNGFGSGPGTIGGDATVNVTANNISTGGSFSPEIFNYFSGINGGGHIGGNATINVAAANITANSVRARIDNSNGGIINNAATVSMSIGGSVTSGPFVADIENSHGHIGTSATVDFHAAGSLNATGADFFDIYNPSGTIGSDATLNVSANDLSAGQLQTIIWNNDVVAGSGPGTIGSDATVNVTADNISTGGTLFADIYNFTATIGSNAMISASANNVSTGGTLDARIDNSFAGTIGGSANIVFNLAGDLTTQGGGDAFLVISNYNGGHIGADAAINLSAASISTAGSLFADIYNYNGGNIGADAAINLSAASISTAGSLFADIYNYQGGNIVGGADLSLNLTGNLTSVGGATLLILNDPAGTIGSDAVINVTANNISTGGTLNAKIENSNVSAIGGNATINVTAANITANSLLAQIDNSNGGSIGSGANLTLNVGGDLTTQGDAMFQILNRDLGSGPGTIGSDATVNVTANNISTGGILIAKVSNSDGGTIVGSAKVVFNLAGDLTGEALLTISGVTIGSDAVINVTAANISTGDSFSPGIFNSGTIGGMANLFFDLSGDLTITSGDAFFRIDNNNANIGGNATISVNAANITANSLLAQINNTSGNIGGNANINFNLTGDLQTVGDASFLIDNSSGGTIGGNTAINVNARTINVGGSLDAHIDNILTIGGTEKVTIQADDNINVGGSISVDGSVTAGGNISAPGIISETVQAGGNISIDNSAGTSGFIVADTIVANGSLNLINVASINPFFFFTGGSIGFTPVDFSLTVGSIVSSGPAIPVLPFDGLDADPNFGDNPGNGGNVTLHITGGGLTIDPTGDLAAITANGGLFATDSTAGGNGGTINITATGDVTLDDGKITATSGLIPPGGPNVLGDGGTVNITTPGTITINSDIEVSSDDPTPGLTPTRRSATGGNINLTSSKTTGVAINITSGGELLALLDPTAPGPGGNITILATGATSQADVSGNVQANRGTVDIQNTGSSGVINLTNAAVHSDVLKVGALGTNGVLNIGGGGGILSADTTLKLYAGGSNGTLNFMSNVTLSSGTAMHLAANTITIQPSVLVTIAGTGDPANIYTNHPNYNFIPGPGYIGPPGNPANGSFGGNGALDPVPLSDAPPFNDPPPPATLATTSTTVKSPTLFSTSGTTSTTVKSPTLSATSGTTSTNLSTKTQSSTNVTSSGTVVDSGLKTTKKTTGTTINVSSSDELLSLLDGAAPGAGGKITIPPSKSASNSKNSNRIDAAARLNAGSRLNADRRAMDLRTASSSVMRRSPQ